MLDAGCAALHEAEAVCTALLEDGATLALIRSVLHDNMDTYIVCATDFIQSVCECWYIPVWYSLGANPHHIASRLFSTD